VWLLNFFDEDTIREKRLRRLEKSLSKLGYASLKIDWEIHKGQPPQQDKSVRVTKVTLVD
jgi:hypothetical protein